MRTDKQKNLDKVAAARLKNPLATQREISNMTGVSQSSVDRADKQLGQIGSQHPAIEELIANDMEIMMLGQREIKNRFLDSQKRGEINNADLNRYTDSAQKRYSLFAGDVTDDKGGLKQVDSLYETLFSD